MNIGDFIVRNPVGVLVRTYVPRAEDVGQNVRKLRDVIGHLFSPEVAGRRVIRSVDFLVWADPRYRTHDGSSASDCGETTLFRSAAFRGDESVGIHEISRGDIYATILNDGLRFQIKRGIRYSIVLSPEVIHLATLGTLEAMIEAAIRGALVVPVAVREIRELVLAGFPCNTFCMWEVGSLWRVGGFDMRDAKPVYPPGTEESRLYEPYAAFIRVGDKLVHDAGVGEVLPACKIWCLEGRPTTAPILPRGFYEGYTTEEISPERREWNEFKFRSKKDRLRNMLQRSSYDLAVQLRAVMPEYLSGIYTPA